MGAGLDSLCSFRKLTNLRVVTSCMHLMYMVARSDNVTVCGPITPNVQLTDKAFHRPEELDGML
jgi:hypothetical protein